MTMELRHLRYFVVVAETLHFSRAAELLHMAQPPLSRQIKMLEDELGVTLLNRTKRTMALTEAGTSFLVRAREILSLAEKAKIEAGSFSSGESGSLHIGFSASVPLMPLFTHAISLFNQRYPGVKLTLEEMASGDQQTALLSQQLDAGFIRAESLPESALLVRELSRENLQLALNEFHPLADSETISLSQLAGERFILCSGHTHTGLMAYTLSLCRRAGFEPNVGQKVHEMTTLSGLVAAGMGVALVPAAMNAVRPEGIRYRSLSVNEANISLWFLRRPGFVSMPLSRFVRCLEELSSGK
ncbi:LysR substrate-binding domain-containing protein [Enterobacter asburiae]